MFLRFHAAQFDSFQQQLQSQRVDLDAAALRLRELERFEGAALESLQVQPEAVAVEDEDLDAIARPIEESKEIAGEGVFSESVPHQPVETVDPPPKIHRLARHKDPYPRRQRQHHTPSRASSASSRLSVGS